MSRIKIQKIGITNLSTDAIVNAANEYLQAGGGVCGAIFRAAGMNKLQAACDKIGHCDTGSAVITPGFGLKAKYVIHAVGPRYSDGKHNEPQLLYGAYESSLKLAMDNGCRSIGFPLISAGIFGYPLKGAWDIAISACLDFIKDNPSYDIEITFAVLDDHILTVGNDTLERLDTDNRPAVKSDWKTVDMPASRDMFILRRTFSDEQMQALRKGNIPKEMEDKWFWYMDGNTLYAHRSWTGFCIYIMEFSADNNHKVTVNRDPEQYKCTSVDEDISTLNKLLDWWTRTPYDHYNQWIVETADMIQKANAKKDTLHIGGREVPAVFFHRPEEPNGYLSNWYRSPFVLDGISFTSAEQYIMYRKCIMFGDTVSADLILKTDDTAKHQEIGRKAKGYIDKVWEGMRQAAAIRGLLAKFTQNEDLKKQLLDTGDAVLVECAYSDKIWACGIGLDNDDRFYTDRWRGQNILGFALMEVRSIIRNGS